MTKLEFIDKINDVLIGLNTAESDALGSLYDELMRDAGWHPASELPPVDEFGESKYLIAYDIYGYAFSAFYSMKKGWCDDDGRDNLEIEWWCYPPKEE